MPNTTPPLNAGPNELSEQTDLSAMIEGILNSSMFQPVKGGTHSQHQKIADFRSALESGAVFDERPIFDGEFGNRFLISIDNFLRQVWIDMSEDASSSEAVEYEPLESAIREVLGLLMAAGWSPAEEIEADSSLRLSEIIDWPSLVAEGTRRRLEAATSAIAGGTPSRALRI